MKHMLLIVVALLGFALITGSVTRGSSELSGPGMIRITSRDVDVKLVNGGSSARGMGDVLVVRQLLFNKGITKNGDRPFRSRLHVHGPQVAAMQRDVFPPEGQDRRLRLDALPRVLQARRGRRHRHLQQRARLDVPEPASGAGHGASSWSSAWSSRNRENPGALGCVKDPEGAEARVLGQTADFTGRRVLEIGCGDGRLTWLYAPRAASVLGIDPDEEQIAIARSATPPELADRVQFEVGEAEDLSRTAVFDVAFLSWSL